MHGDGFQNSRGSHRYLVDSRAEKMGEPVGSFRKKKTGYGTKHLRRNSQPCIEKCLSWCLYKYLLREMSLIVAAPLL